MNIEKKIDVHLSMLAGPFKQTGVKVGGVIKSRSQIKIR
jgi:hypothetical protein